MERIRKHFPLKANGQRENVIQASFYYDLGGMDFWSGKSKPRGYYLNLIPMERKGSFSTYSPLASGGGYTLIAPAARQSKSREKAAFEECQRRLPELMGIVLGNTGFELEPGTALSMA